MLTRAPPKGEADRPYRSPDDWLGQERIAGDVEMVAGEPGGSQLARLEAGREHWRSGNIERSRPA
jgi:hypothetical protein